MKIAKNKNLPLRERLPAIRAFIMDVDGTLTDSAMYFTAEGESMKRFSTRDGMGIELLRRAGIMPVIMTSESSPIVAARAKKLEIEHVILGTRNKKESILKLSADLNMGLEEMAFIGDDVNDENPIKMVAVGGCPADSVRLILQTADYICHANGGNGAVREFAEFILLGQGKPISLPEKF